MGIGAKGEHLPHTEADQMCGCSFSQKPELPGGLRGNISSVAHPVATHDALQRVTKLLQNQESENLLPAEKSLQCQLWKKKKRNAPPITSERPLVSTPGSSSSLDFLVPGSAT